MAALLRLVAERLLVPFPSLLVLGGLLLAVIDGESLLNDATAFVAYRMAVAAVVAGTFSLWQANLRLVIIYLTQEVCAD